jgi:YVTN family beta-propeller protein
MKISNIICAGILLLWSIGCDATDPSRRPSRRLFVSNYGDGTVSVIDGDLEREVDTIEIGGLPEALAVRTDEPLLAVVNSGESQVALVDPVELEVLATMPTNKGAEDVVFSADGKTLFVTAVSDKVINVFDPDARTPIGDPITVTSGRPRRLALSSDGSRLYVLVYDPDGHVAVVDVATRQQVGDMIPVGRYPCGIAISGDGRRVLAASFDDNTVTVIDAQSLKPIATHEVKTGLGLVAHKRKPLLYSMASFDDAIPVLNFETGKVLTTLSLGKWPTYGVMTPDGRFLYAVHQESHSVVKIDVETNESVLKIAVGREPLELLIYDLPDATEGAATKGD